MKNNKSIQNLKELKLSPGQALLIVIEKYKKQISKNSRNLNEYDGLCHYLDKKFKEVEWVAQNNNLAIKDILYLKSIFLKRLTTIDFLKAYSKHKFKFQEGIHLEITNESFSDYIHSEMIAPELADTEKFVKDSLFSSVLRDSYLNLIKNIKELIDTYQGSNKEAIVYLFNMNMDLLASYIQETLNPDIECINNKLIKYVKELQKNENEYYTHLFFAKNFRKRNSSLQLKINGVRNLINEFINDGPTQSQAIKAKI